MSYHATIEKVLHNSNAGTQSRNRKPDNYWSLKGHFQ